MTLGTYASRAAVVTKYSIFLIYINDIVNYLGCNIRLFADDTSLYVIVDDEPASASDLVDSDLQTIHNWAQNWLVTT